MKMAINMFPGFGWIETGRSKFRPINKIKNFKNYSSQNMSMIKVVLLFLYSSTKKKLREFWLIFNKEK
jgi:hypothetical protein